MIVSDDQGFPKFEAMPEGMLRELGIVQGKSLIPYGEHNRRALMAWNGGKQEQPLIPNGIACPCCGNETSDSLDGPFRGSQPPIIECQCPACGWSGNRYMMPKKKEGTG